MATTIKKATKIDWYARFIAEHLVLAIDDKGLYCKIASERIEGLVYRVDMDEATMVATRCQCPSYRPCQHMRIATSVFAYKASEGICEVEAGRWYILNSDTQIWLQDGEWVAVGPTENAVEIVKNHLEKQQEVIEEPIVPMPAQEVVESAAVAAEARTYYWCPNRCCYKWSDTHKVCEPQPDGKIWNSDICDWVMPPSGEPIDHTAELAAAGWHAASKRSKDTEKALIMADISKLTENRMMNAALNGAQGFNLYR